MEEQFLGNAHAPPRPSIEVVEVALDLLGGTTYSSSRGWLRRLTSPITGTR